MLHNHDLKPASRSNLPELLPMLDTSPINLQTELDANFRAAKLLRDTLSMDSETPANQKAQVMNTITTILSQMTKVQMDLFNVQRQKEIEGILIETIKEQPEDLQDKFFALYESKLAKQQP